jgi:Tfp pilus assembly protein PilO
MVKTDELQKLEIYLNRLIIFNRSFNGISELDKERLEKTIPENNNYEDLISMFENIVNNRGLRLTSIFIDDVKGKIVSKRTKITEEDSILPEGVSEINFSISVSGTNYETMKDLISDFEKNLRIVDIKSVDFSNLSSLKLEMTAYYFSL